MKTSNPTIAGFFSFECYNALNQMSYSFHAYTVPAGSIQKLRGSKDSAILAELLDKLDSELQENDEFFEDMESEEAGEPMKGCLGFVLRMVIGKERFEKQQAKEVASGPVPSSADLLRSFVNGEPIDIRCDSKMGYVLKMICEHTGEFQINAGLAGIRRGEQWADEVNKFLVAQGVNLDLAKNLTKQNQQLGVDDPDDFPAIGYLSLSLLQANDSKLQAIDTSSVVMPSYYSGEDSDDEEHESDDDDVSTGPTDYLLLTVKSLQSWSLNAIQNQCDVVTFYH